MVLKTVPEKLVTKNPSENFYFPLQNRLYNLDKTLYKVEYKTRGVAWIKVRFFEVQSYIIFTDFFAKLHHLPLDKDDKIVDVICKLEVI